MDAGNDVSRWLIRKQERRSQASYIGRTSLGSHSIWDAMRYNRFESVAGAEAIANEQAPLLSFGEVP